MAYRHEWEKQRTAEWGHLRGQYDGDEFNKAIDDLDRDHEYQGYKSDEREAVCLKKAWEANNPDENNVDELHADADMLDQARAATMDAANQRYTFNGRWIKEGWYDDDDPNKPDAGHRQQAEDRSNSGSKLLKYQGGGSIEEEHAEIDKDPVKWARSKKKFRKQQSQQQNQGSSGQT